MKKLWDVVGFTPSSFELDVADASENGMDAPLLESASFPPSKQREAPTERDVEQYDGLTVKNIPSHLDDKQIFEFLFNYGLPDDHGIDLIRINKDKKNTWVVVDGLTPDVVNTMISSLHFPKTRQKFFDVPIYCRGLRNMTPIKDKPITDNEDPTPKSPGLANNPAETPKVTPIPGLSKSQQKKALRRAKATEARNKTCENKSSPNKGPTISKNKTKKDFMKSNIFNNLADDFEFEERSTEEEEDDKTPKSKFFTKSPLEKMSQKEEQWKNILNEETKKRQSSPEDPTDRNTRPRSESFSFSFAPGPTKKLYK